MLQIKKKKRMSERVKKEVKSHTNINQNASTSVLSEQKPWVLIQQIFIGSCNVPGTKTHFISMTNSENLSQMSVSALLF